jgi:hypothetical protein
VVLDNVRNCVLENIQTMWPDAPAAADMKEDAPWPGIYASLPMHGIAMRRVDETTINCPYLTASQDDVEPMLEIE